MATPDELFRATVKEFKTHVFECHYYPDLIRFLELIEGCPARLIGVSVEGHPIGLPSSGMYYVLYRHNEVLVGMVST